MRTFSWAARSLVAGWLSLSVAACGAETESPVDAGAAVDAGVDAGTPMRSTYRVVGGVSMGAMGGSMLGLRHPEMFDGIVALGGPVDGPFLTRLIGTRKLGGFCPLPRLEAQLAANPALLNDPRTMDCDKDVPGEVSSERSEHFNKWAFTNSGGHFTRNSHIEIFTDLAIAFGNLTSYNPASSFAPAGIPPEVAANPPANICSAPYRIKGKLSDPSGTPIYSAEWNPAGKYDVITFCDGEESPTYYCVDGNRHVDFCAAGDGSVVPRAQERSYAERYCAGPVSTADDSDATSDAVFLLYEDEQGRYDPCREHDNPARILTAVDLNGNGKRDYAEPVLFNAYERWKDTGPDGCFDALENGSGGCVSDASQSPFARGVTDPNGDDYDVKRRPLGTEKNFKHDEGEAYDDFGLDGVAATGDFGEGNGKFDRSPNLDRLAGYDPRGNYEKLDAAGKARLDVYAEGGIRDIFNFGVAGQLLHASTLAFNPTELPSTFTGFGQLPLMGGGFEPEETIDSQKIDWSRIGRNVGMTYGVENQTVAQHRQGEGDHVGTNRQALLRFFAMESWVASRWPNLPLPERVRPGDYNARQISTTYFSPALDSPRDFTIYLPPGYFDPTQAGQRYPVLYLMHGYGMREDDFSATSVAIFEPPMTGRLLPGINPMNQRRYISVFVSGRCCHTGPNGQKDCTLAHLDAPGWKSSCETGNFYVNAQGRNGDGVKYDDSFLDLVKYVDENYRTMPTQTVVR